MHFPPATASGHAGVGSSSHTSTTRYRPWSGLNLDQAREIVNEELFPPPISP